MNLEKCFRCSAYLVHDHREGTIVCTKCAYVNSNSYFCSSHQLNCYDEKYSCDDYNTICDFVANTQMPEYISAHIYDCFCKLRKKSKSRKRELLAYSIYDYCIKNDVCINVQKLADFFSICSKSVFILKRRSIDYASSVTQPEQFLDMLILQAYDLSFKDIEKIKKLTIYMSAFSSSSPYTIIAAAIYSFTSYYKASSHTLSSICERCSISKSCVEKLLKKINKKKVEIIIKEK